MVEAVFVADVAGNLTLANRAAMIMFDISEAQQSNERVQRFFNEGFMRHLDRRLVTWDELPLVRALKGETVVMSQPDIVRKAGRPDVYVEASAAPLRDTAGAIVGAIVVGRDVTGAMELERLKDEFLALAAHELKTPVAIVKGSAQVALTRESLDPSVAGLLDRIVAGADRIDRIVTKLLDVSQLQAGRLALHPERVDLGRIAETVVTRLPAASRARVELSTQPAEVVGDWLRLGQIIRELVENALQFSPAATHVSVRVDSDGLDALVVVSDHGVGIPIARQARVFDRFRRNPVRDARDPGGMGVGLFFVREMIARHDGRIWFTSDEGHGSVFSFILPLAPARTL